MDEKPRVPVFSIEGDLAGQLGVMTTRYEDTFAAIGNQNSLGYLELVKANPQVDPWLPGEGTVITVPRRYVLPDVERKGIVINLAEYRLYYFTETGVQVYPVGVGTEENPSPLTDAQVTMALESPAWYPPASIRAEYEADGDYLPRMIPPGPDNPLGSHALMLSEKGYLIHGTNKLFGVGMQVSHGCFRMYNEDISRFVHEVGKGTPVRVIKEPVKIGMRGNEVWLEVHRPEEDYSVEDREALWQAVSRVVEAFRDQRPGVEVQRSAIDRAVDLADGLPRMIGEQLTQVARENASPGRSTPNSDGVPQQLWF
ncbi:L,D-transpeptidase family protein [Marinobacter sp. CHS3-4]|uniref:L,D-transpeptidase family protein n=1 Tax=Marinobacter sp. CHS3-4 TaxID=3045174 RepID=UPI0024B493B6|nr:L,D-transpeptidase family protein [Marinobacter sp. CHS3-4]MDI9243696.1 L,D-transpeptidase family protein [Marinobacter sp. CHS3-4]